MSCDKVSEVQRYHDGEMPEAQRVAFVQHLGICQPCAIELESLRQLSKLIAGTVVPRLSGAAMARLHRSYEKATERGVLRIAEWLTAAAAAVLLLGLIGLYRQAPVAPRATAATPASWEMESTGVMANDTESVASARPELVQMAVWMAGDLAQR